MPGTSKRSKAPKRKQPPKSPLQDGWLLSADGQDYRRARLGYNEGAHCTPTGTCGALWSQSRISSLGSEWRKRARDTMSHSARNREPKPGPHQDGVASKCLDRTDSDPSLVDAPDLVVVWRHPPEPRPTPRASVAHSRQLATTDPRDVAAADPRDVAAADPRGVAAADPCNIATTDPRDVATADPRSFAAADPRGFAAAYRRRTVVAMLCVSAHSAPPTHKDLHRIDLFKVLPGMWPQKTRSQGPSEPR